MNEKLQNALIQLAEKLGTTVEYLFSIMIRQALTQGITNLVVAFIMVLSVTWLFKLLKTDIDELTNEQDIKFTICLAMAGVLIATTGFYTLFSLQETITCFTNPEFWALEQILNKLK